MNRSTAKPHIKTKLPGPKARKWIEFHLKHAAKATYEKRFVWDRQAPAAGPFCSDPDGNIFLDFASHVAANPLGYNHPKLTKAAQQLAAFSPDRYAGTDFITALGSNPSRSPFPTPAHLHQKLVEITKPFDFKTSFLVNSGAEAVENAIKCCYSYRRNNGYAIVFDGAFHGRTLGALSLNRSKAVHRAWYPGIPKVISLPFKSCVGDICHFDPPSHDPATSLQALIDPKAGLISAEEVAFIIIEPIQGEGGYNFPNPLFLKELIQVTSSHNIPLICDEVQVGLGRTGKWWASEHYGLKPDLITAGKALQVGATIGKSKMFPKQSSRIGSTWGEGNAIATAMGYLTIQIIQDEKLLENTQTLGEYFLNELKHLKKQHPKKLTDARGLGFLLALEFKTSKQRDAFQQKAFEYGLILLGCGHKAVRILPPLNATKREINLALEIITTCLNPKSA